MPGHDLGDGNCRLGVVESLGYEALATLNTRQTRPVYRLRRGDRDDVVKVWQTSKSRGPPYFVKKPWAPCTDAGERRPVLDRRPAGEVLTEDQKELIFRACKPEFDLFGWKR